MADHKDDEEQENHFQVLPPVRMGSRSCAQCPGGKLISLSYRPDHIRLIHMPLPRYHCPYCSDPEATNRSHQYQPVTVIQHILQQHPHEEPEPIDATKNNDYMLEYRQQEALCFPQTTHCMQKIYDLSDGRQTKASGGGARSTSHLLGEHDIRKQNKQEKVSSTAARFAGGAGSNAFFDDEQRLRLTIQRDRREIQNLQTEVVEERERANYTEIRLALECYNGNKDWRMLRDRILALQFVQDDKDEKISKLGSQVDSIKDEWKKAVQKCNEVIAQRNTAEEEWRMAEDARATVEKERSKALMARDQAVKELDSAKQDHFIFVAVSVMLVVVIGVLCYFLFH